MASGFWEGARGEVRAVRLLRAVSSYNAAITRREKELIRMGEHELVPLLPKRKTFAGEKERIKDSNDYRRIVGYSGDAERGRVPELSRVLKKYRPNALEFDFNMGITNYEKALDRANRASATRSRRKNREILETPQYEGDDIIDYSGLSEVEKANIASDNDIRDSTEGEFDSSVVDVPQSTIDEWTREDNQNQRDSVKLTNLYDVYRACWVNEKNGHSEVGYGYQELLDALDWLADNRPALLNKMFMSGADEMQISYICESGSGDNPYENIDYEVRHRNAVHYITGKARAARWEG